MHRFTAADAQSVQYTTVVSQIRRVSKYNSRQTSFRSLSQPIRKMLREDGFTIETFRCSEPKSRVKVVKFMVKW